LQRFYIAKSEESILKKKTRMDYVIGIDIGSNCIVGFVIVVKRNKQPNFILMSRNYRRVYILYTTSFMP